MPGLTLVTVNVPINPDNIAEPPENFFPELTLVSSTDDDVQLEPDEAEVIIRSIGGTFLHV